MNWSGTRTFTVSDPTGNLNVTGTFAYPTGFAGSLIKAGAGTLTLSDANNYAGYTSINASGGTLVIGGAGKIGNGSYANNIFIGSDSVLSYNSSSSQTFSALVYGPGSLVKANTGLLILSYSGNSYGGGTTISAGTVYFSSATTPAGSGGITLGDANSGTNSVGLLVLYPNALSGNAITVANQGSGPVTLSIVTTTPGQTFNMGTLALNRGATLDAPNLDNTSDWLNLSVVASGGGTLTIGSTGDSSAHRLTLSGGAWPDYTGDIIISNGGELHPSGKLTTVNGNNVTVSSGGVLGITWADTSINALNGTGAVRGLAAGGTHTLIVGVGGGSGSFSGVISDNGATISLTKAGGGTQILSGASTYTGYTTINNSGGTLEIGGAGKLGNGSYANNIFIGSGSLLLYNSSANQTFSGQIYDAGALTKAGTGTLTLSSALNSWSGATTVSNGTLEVTTGAKLGASTNILVAGGLLVLQGSGAINAIANTAALRITGGQVQPASGATEQVRELYLAGARMYKGTWGHSGSGALYTNDTYFAAGGIVSVSEGAPHPATTVMFR
jgi:fibronectin-binding autotransporter adhesin